MNHGDKKHDKRRQASPFLKYVIKKYDIPLENDDDVKGEAAIIEEDFTTIARRISNSVADPTTNPVSIKSSKPSVTESVSGVSSVCDLPTSPIHMEHKAVSQAPQ